MPSVSETVILNDLPLLIKVVDHIDEQYELNEYASLKEVLEWLDRINFRHLYQPLYRTDQETIIKCYHGESLLAAVELLYGVNTTEPEYLSKSANLYPLASYTLSPRSLILNYESWTPTLRDLVTFSPYSIANSNLRLLFICYQLLKTIFFVHHHGLSTGPLQLTDIHITERYWIQIRLRFNACLATLEVQSLDDDNYYTHQRNSTQSTITDLQPSKYQQKLTTHTNNPFVQAYTDEPQLQISFSTSLLLESSLLANSPVYHVEQRYLTYCTTLFDIPELIKQWQLGRISNFDYLLILNALAGRKFNHPDKHPILPWITDFTTSCTNLRDLTKSKYRLNKGDAQLDLTYNYYYVQSSSATAGNLTAHHLCEYLSSITYYVYKARRMSKSILCENVRSSWVPNEYPSSITRLVEWTPEECIPEFFYDSTIFQSIHDDLDDLHIPNWCTSTDEFVEKHRQLLESREVSAELHFWIDLVFGYKLTGEHAIEAKNVCLSLVDHHENIRDNGIVQLFLTPHPARFRTHTTPITSSSLISTTSSSSFKSNPVIAQSSRASSDINSEQTKQTRASSVASINVNDPLISSFNNLLSNSFSHLDAIEQLLRLSSETFAKLPTSSEKSSKFNSSYLNTCQRDLQYFGIILIELILLSKHHFIPININATERLTIVQKLLIDQWHLIPTPFRACLQLLFNISENDDRLFTNAPYYITAGYLLNYWTTPLPFPFYFDDLYRFLHEFELIDREIARQHDNIIIQRRLYCKKVNLLTKSIPNLLLSMQTHNYELLLPYILDSFRHPVYGVQIIYELFNSTALVLGPDECRKHLLPLILTLLNPDKCSAYHWRLFSKNFLIQLISRFGLNRFLNNFTVLIIEACSGFKDSFQLIDNVEVPSTDVGGVQWSLGNNTQDDSISLNNDNINEFIRQSPIEIETNDVESVENFIVDNDNISNNCELVTISETVVDSIHYFISKLGPVLACKQFGRNLLRMLTLCYVDNEQLEQLTSSENPFMSIRPIIGDLNAMKIIECLKLIAQLYGEQVILLFYFPYLIETVKSATQRLTIRTEAGVLAALVLLKSVLPFLTDASLMIHLSDLIKLRLIHPIIQLLSSTHIHFPTYDRSRTVSVYRVLDVLFLLSLRLGYENTRISLNDSIRLFFNAFNVVHDYMEHVLVNNHLSSNTQTNTSLGSQNGDMEMNNNINNLNVNVNSTGSESAEDEFCRITIDSLTHDYKIGSPVRPHGSVEINQKKGRSHSHSLLAPPPIEDDSQVHHHTSETIQAELRKTFTSELACIAYVQFCRLCGDHHMNSLVSRNEFISRSLSDNERGVYSNSITSVDDVQQPAFNESSFASSVLISIRDNDIKHTQLDETRFLRKNWLAYWEHEVGRSEKDSALNFKQIHLQSFIGHTNCVRALHVLDDESTFISGARDRTVRIWQVENQGEGFTKVEQRWTYTGHKKTIFSVKFLDSLRLVASCDGSIHVYDPFRAVSQPLWRHQNTKENLPFSAMTSMGAPSTFLLAATGDVLRFLDVRTKNAAYEWKLTPSPLGQIKTIATNPNSYSALVGFSTGTVSVFDVRSGIIQGTLKVPEGEILKVNFYSRNRFYTSSADGSIYLWNTRELSSPQPTLLKSHVDSAPMVSSTNNEIIVGTTTNKLCIYSNLKSTAQIDCQSSKLQSDNFKGIMSSMGLFPLNRLFLFGSDTGNIELLC